MESSLWESCTVGLTLQILTRLEPREKWRPQPLEPDKAFYWPTTTKEISLEHSSAPHIHRVERTDCISHLSSHRTTNSWTTALVEVAFRNYRNSQKMLKMNMCLGIMEDTTKWSKGFESRNSRKHSIATHKIPIWLRASLSGKVKQNQTKASSGWKLLRTLDSTWSQIMLTSYRAIRWIDQVMCCV